MEMGVVFFVNAKKRIFWKYSCLLSVLYQGMPPGKMMGLLETMPLRFTRSLEKRCITCYLCVKYENNSYH